ncbi:MAG: hypothetical protein R3B97_04210 [Dehalococcoidia bacterium]|nr:hypothetical protein [Dehalococcoidia bacterium]MCB9485481.1 hypothetical protein [Thermoflexaceae bacterium]
MTERPRKPRQSATLRRLLDGYLHQDLRLEYGSAEAAAAAFARDATAAERAWARAALLRFAAWADGLDEDTWRPAWRAQGGAWRPEHAAEIHALALRLKDHDDHAGD